MPDHEDSMNQLVAESLRRILLNVQAAIESGEIQVIRNTYNLSLEQMAIYGLALRLPVIAKWN